MQTSVVGQKKLKEKLNNVSIESFPKSLILCGDSGCGKHLLCSILEQKFSAWEFFYVKPPINYSFVESCYLVSIPTFYVFDADNLTEREQNVLLKLFEEPVNNVNIILLSTNTSLLLNTVINRAVIWEFEPYTESELSVFLQGKNPELLSLVTTPGQLLSLSDANVDSMVDLSNLIIDKIGKASISNTLSLSSKFVSKDATTAEFDLMIFIRLFRKILYNKIKCSSEVRYEKAFVVTNKFYNTLLQLKNLNKKYLFENFILELKASLI